MNACVTLAMGWVFARTLNRSARGNTVDASSVTLKELSRADQAPGTPHTPHTPRVTSGTAAPPVSGGLSSPVAYILHGDQPSSAAVPASGGRDGTNGDGTFFSTTSAEAAVTADELMPAGLSMGSSSAVDGDHTQPGCYRGGAEAGSWGPPRVSLSPIWCHTGVSRSYPGTVYDSAAREGSAASGRRERGRGASFEEFLRARRILTGMLCLHSCLPALQHGAQAIQ